MSTEKEIVLGYLDTPPNQLLLQSRFTPSKAGGNPAWLTKEDVPSQWCECCEHKLTFLLQLSANIMEKEFDVYHRMLYVFVCLSEKCINT